jgi:ribonuclease HII
MPNASFYHSVLLPKTLSIWQAEIKLKEHFPNCVLIGIDEAGRGPLAGPVVAAAVVLKPAMALEIGNSKGKYEDLPIMLLHDSKKLSEKQRELILSDLPNYCEYHSIGEASAAEIDENGILDATFSAMKRALHPIISELAEKNLPYKLLVDGNLYISEINEALQMPIIKGDERIASISAASIFAKVHRDKLMIKLAEQFPKYGFENHKGYGTKAHLDAIKEFGWCEIHRKTFKVK